MPLRKKGLEQVNRRSFLGSMLAAAAAPAIVRAEVLMRLAPPRVVTRTGLAMLGPHLTATEVLERQREWLEQTARLIERMVNLPLIDIGGGKLIQLPAPPAGWLTLTARDG